ncbi:MAG: thiosulfate oxidation carrier protein SoxY [Thiotrichales bacterium]
MLRRSFLKGTLAAGAAGVAVSAGLLTPQRVLAAWPEAAFTAKDVAGALSAIGAGGAADSADISIKAPDIAENGAVVPVTVETSVGGVESIAILASANGSPLTSQYMLGAGADAFVSTRVKLAKTSDVIAVVKAGGKVMSAKKEVKVTIGGCGG